MNSHFDQNFGNPNNNFINNYSSNNVCNYNNNVIYYNSSNYNSSKMDFSMNTSYMVNKNQGYTTIHYNNISLEFCRNHCG